MSTIFSRCPTERAVSRNGGIVCQCLGITRTEIGRAIEAGEIQTLKCVIRNTTAGSGCTACHSAIRAMIAETASPADASKTVAFQTMRMDTATG